MVIFTEEQMQLLDLHPCGAVQKTNVKFGTWEHSRYGVTYSCQRDANHDIRAMMQAAAARYTPGSANFLDVVHLCIRVARDTADAPW